MVGPAALWRKPDCLCSHLQSWEQVDDRGSKLLMLGSLEKYVGVHKNGVVVLSCNQNFDRLVVGLGI